MKNTNPPKNFPHVARYDRNHRIEASNLPLELLYPVAHRILTHLHKHGFTTEHKAAAIQVFGDIIFNETGCDPEQLLDAAEKIARSFGETERERARP